MDWLTFIIELVKALAWPVTIIFLVYQFRDSIVEMLAKVRSLKYKDFEAILKDIEKDEKAVPDLKVESSVSPKVEGKGLDFGEVYSLLETSPNMAVVRAWSLIEIEAFVALTKVKKLDERSVEKIPRSPLLLLRELKEAGLVDDKLIKLLEHLRALRNGILHSSLVKLEEKDALRYLEAAEKVYYFLREMPRVG
ncbi:MAG: hypothetical protein HGA87_02120 [Desulfobulbaceae bacterium]|nr:hypothetical protein [Desulfobulbaceae bacterium]